MLFGDLSFSSTSPLKIAAWEAGGEVAKITKYINFRYLEDIPKQ